MYILIIVYHIILSRKWRFLSLAKFLLKTFLLIFYKKIFRENDDVQACGRGTWLAL